MAIGMRATKPPMLSIQPKGVNITVPAALDFYVIDGEERPLTFTMGVVSRLSLRADILSDDSVLSL